MKIYHKYISFSTSYGITHIFQFFQLEGAGGINMILRLSDMSWWKGGAQVRLEPPSRQMSSKRLEEILFTRIFSIPNTVPNVLFFYRTKDVCEQSLLQLLKCILLTDLSSILPLYQSTLGEYNITVTYLEWKMLEKNLLRSCIGAINDHCRVWIPTTKQWEPLREYTIHGLIQLMQHDTKA